MQDSDVEKFGKYRCYKLHCVFLIVVKYPHLPFSFQNLFFTAKPDSQGKGKKCEIDEHVAI